MQTNAVTNNTCRGMKRLFSLLLCLALLSSLFVSTVWAADEAKNQKTVDPVNQPDNYSAVLYDNRNGLPTAEANAIAQTSEGFIWIGSYGGLIRYDGNTFVRMDSTTGVASVVSLFVDSRDRLWIGTNDSGLALMENGKFTIWGKDDGLGSSYVCAIAEDVNGMIYAGTTEGITMVSPDDYSLRHVDDPKVASAYIESIRAGSDGLLYCLTNDDDFFTLKDGKLVDYIDHDAEDMPGFTSILPDLGNPRETAISITEARKISKTWRNGALRLFRMSWRSRSSTTRSGCAAGMASACCKAVSSTT